MGRKREIQDDPVVHFEARTDQQELAVQAYQENDLLFLLGPSGTGKTHVAVYCALMDLRGSKVTRHRPCERIFITRPSVEAGEDPGALPGGVDEKMEPYMIPIYDCVGKMLHRGNDFIDEHVEVAPLAYMRGRTFEHCVAILDEAQNCTVSQLKLYMTRLGGGGKMIISGDMNQSDIGAASGLRPWVKSLKGSPGIGFIEFTEADIVRHPLVRTVLEKSPK